MVAFDRARADESAEDFVKEVLVDRLDARLVVVGEDFHFGHGRKGNVALLTELGQRYGFEVVGARLTGDGTDAGLVHPDQDAGGRRGTWSGRPRSSGGPTR